MTTQHQQDMIEVLMEDHREVEQLFGLLEIGQGTAEYRRGLADAMTAELVRHSVAEEQYLYPTARRVLPDGDTLADREIEDHATVEKMLKQLESVSAEDERFDRLVATLISDVRGHIREEEDELFPRLREACSAEDLARLGEKTERAKSVAPTRPHPASPDHPPFNTLLAPGAGLVDRIRDALSGRTTSPDQAIRGE